MRFWRFRPGCFSVIRSVIWPEAARYNAASAAAAHGAVVSSDRQLARDFIRRIDRLVDAGVEYGEACQIAARHHSETV